MAFAVYVASALGFTEFGAVGARALARRVHDRGFLVLDPWSTPEGAALNALVRSGAPIAEIAEQNRRVGAANRSMIERARAVLACLDGPAVDDGTAAEVGFAAGIGRLVIGFRSDSRLAGDNAATTVNLQIVHFIESTGGCIASSLDAALHALATRRRANDSH